ncbi:MAG: HDOD domain-containing protein [Planctomycetaceae bacterium]
MVDPQKIWNSSQLPTLPTVAVRLLDLSRDPEAEIRDVIEVLKSDPALSAKILKSTNSSFFGFKSQVTSIDRAVPLLGTTVVTSLALSFSLVEAAMTTGPMAGHYNSYWKQSIVQASAAEILSKYSGKGLECEFFLAGLLADLGRLAMLKTVPRDYQPVIEAANQEQGPLIEFETRMLGVNHVEIGSKLMENWKLPAALVQAVRMHHADLAEFAALESTGEYGLVRTVALAAAAGEYFCTTNKGQALDRLQKLGAEFFDFCPQETEEFLANTRSRMEQAGDLFAVNFDELGEPSELMAMANEQLAQLALREHVASTQAVAQREVAERENIELASKNVQLQRQALHDPLTLVYNRHFFDEALATAVHACSRSSEAIGIVFADIDKFKTLNDTYGHPFGDQVLQQVAAAYSETVRKSDIVARYGGEEFVVVVRQPTEKGLQKLAERLRERVESLEIFFGETRVPVTISVGAAIGIPERKATDFGSQLIAAADESMYQAKQGGRNQVRFKSLLNEGERRLAQLSLEYRFSRWLVKRGYFDIAAVSKAVLNCQPPRLRIGEIAQQQGLLNQPQISRIRQIQQQTGDRFGQIAMQQGYISEDQLAVLLAQQSEDPVLLSRALVSVDLTTADIASVMLNQYFAETGSQAVTPVVPQVASV